MQKSQKINSQLLTIAYGAVVSQVVKDSENLTEANQTLEKIGFNIGQRIVDEFMAKVSICSTFDQIVQGFVKNGLKMFLGLTTQVKDYVFESDTKQKNLSFYLVLKENPLLNYVELPSDLQPLEYQNIVCGIIRGAFYTLNLSGKVSVSRDTLKQPNEGTIIHAQMRKQIVKYGED